MSAFSAINLSALPPPPIVVRKEFETILAEIKTWLFDLESDLEPVLGLESEPITKVVEAWAYREMLLRAEFDEAARGNMLAFATGAQLDHLAAFYGVERAVVQAADNTAIPAIPEVLEEDTRLRQRTQLALEGFSTAGPIGSYVFWGLSASTEVKDISVQSPTPGDVLVTVLSDTADGVPNATLLQTVEDQLNDEDVRPLCDQVSVQGATVTHFDLTAELTLYDGPDSEVVRLAAEAAATTYVADHHRLGHDITLSGLYAALHQPGVQKVAITSPAVDIVIGVGEAAYCDTVTVTFGGRDA